MEQRAGGFPGLAELARTQCEHARPVLPADRYRALLQVWFAVRLVLGHNVRHCERRDGRRRGRTGQHANEHRYGHSNARRRYKHSNNGGLDEYTHGGADIHTNGAPSDKYTDRQPGRRRTSADADAHEYTNANRDAWKLGRKHAAHATVVHQHAFARGDDHARGDEHACPNEHCVSHAAAHKHSSATKHSNTGQSGRIVAAVSRGQLRGLAWH